MAVEVVLPMLGVTVEKGSIIEWLKEEGDPVVKGESLYIVEADKVTTEVESPATGILGRILVPVGMEVPVLTVVAVIVQEGEAVPAEYQLQAAGTAPGAEAADRPAPPPAAAREYDYDLAVIGGGPGGYVAAIRAAQLGARVMLAEQDRLGGTCLNRGCVPTKSFLADVKHLHHIRASAVYTGKERLGISMSRLVARKDRVVATMTEGVEVLLKANRVKLFKARASLLDPHTVKLVSPEGETTVSTGRVIIATGSQAASLPGLEFDGRRILSSDHILELKSVPKSLAIIGGGAVGLEFGTIFNSLGSQVTVIEMLPGIAAGQDQEIVEGLSRALGEQGLKILTDTRVLGASLDKEGVTLELEEAGGGRRSLSAQKVLVAAGRTPVCQDLGLEELGVEMDGPFIAVDSQLQTSVAGLYAIGDVIGKSMLAHTASQEGIVAAENSVVDAGRSMDYRRIPSCIYTFPEVASVGLGEDEARHQGLAVKVGRFPYRFNGKALAMDRPEGFVKVVADELTGEILGVHILGEQATDLIGEALLAMQAEAVVEDLGEVVKAHPTLSEIVKEAALDYSGLAVHKP